ncbi:MAG: SDR family oxidoreductase [Candidatus Binataceae bacterium]|jgi:NAD(P)-dependent dehydrogenase (short-subunit alcohol dehydrogenase family)
MAGTLDGKVALITGAASGIGRATALAFVRAGARVVACDTDQAGGEQTLAKIQAENGKAEFFRTDVSQASQVEDLIAKIVKAHGRLDCAFNNAGSEGEVALTADHNERNFDHVMAVNVKGVWLCMKYELKQMVKQGRGAIVNTASVAGLVGFAGLPIYVASKHAVVGLTKTAAIEYALAGVRVNALCPGPIDTPMMERIGNCEGWPKRSDYEGFVPMRRYGTPDEMANVVTWLCSDAASYINGATLPGDGGLVAQ